MQTLMFGSALLAAVHVAIAGAPALTREGPMEKIALVSASDPKTWSAAECTASPSTDHVKTEPTSWRWHVDVDYSSGEAKYPIGWPRISHAIPAGELRDWSDWDFLHAWVYVETSRATLPAVPAGLGLQTPDRANSFNRTLAELKKDRWIELNIPVPDIPRHNDVRSLQFHVAEADYQDHDRLDFYLNDLSLTRYAVPTVARLQPENALLYTDATRLGVRFDVLGLRRGQASHVRCELVHDGNVVASTVATVGRGLQRVVLQLAPRNLAPGAYEVRAFIAGIPTPTTAVVRAVESPWTTP